MEMRIWEEVSDQSSDFRDRNKITKLRLKYFHYSVDLWSEVFPGGCHIVPWMAVKAFVPQWEV